MSRTDKGGHLAHAGETQAQDRGPGIEDGASPSVWRYARASRAAVLIDAADYFSAMQQAMLKAQARIFLIGWDFDTRIYLDNGAPGHPRGEGGQSYPPRLGAFFSWLVETRPTLEIRILKWSFGMFKFVLRSSMWMDLLRWARHPRIDFMFDSAHPVGCSHHQKIAVIDNTLAVCGGIDMTVKRWDTRDHPPVNPRRRLQPHGDHHDPWHDASMIMEGPVADALAELGEDRWERAGGKPLAPIAARTESIWPDGLHVTFEDVEIGIARTRAGYGDCEPVNEIERLFLEHIGRAKKFIYAESQYFASRKVAEAIIARVQQDDCPEIVIVHPANADGWLEQQAMDHSRAELVRLINAADRKDRFSIWSPVNDATHIYVHAKIMIVDDEIFRIGSANINNRSLGLDSECDVFVDTARPVNAHAGPAITAIRHSLLAEHLGLAEKDIGGLLEKHGSMRALIDAAITETGRNLLEYIPPELNEVQQTLAESALLDPEKPDDMFEPYARGGMFRAGSRLKQVRDRFRRRRKR